MVTSEHVQDALRGVVDPELGANIVDLGLVYDVQVIGRRVFVTMTLTTPLCPMNEMIPDAVRQAVGVLPDVAGVDVDLVWTPPWEPQMMSRELKERLGW
ncbi:MAG TPA: metal-sulfur cluster assembly factor [bacterium]|nr:metal-sulfur cluster assembly factor [bacterium]